MNSLRIGWLLCGLLLCVFHEAAAQGQAAPGSYLSEGDQRLAVGDHHGAERAYREALEDGRHPVEAYVGLARVAVAEKKWKEAGDWLEQALALAPDDKAALYYNGIRHREQAKFRTFNQIIHWRGAENAFQQIIAQDSLYEDVFYQYALLRRYDEAYTDAIELGHVQLRLKPDLDAGRYGLFKLYQNYLRNTDREEACAWLQAREGAWPQYFAAECLRLAGRLDEADAGFVKLTGHADLEPQALLLSRAKVQYAKGDPIRGEGYVREAVEAITRPIQAALVFDDFKYVANDAELAQYRQLKAPEEYKDFLYALWISRNPMPARPVNVRLTEHYRRLLKAEQDYAFDGFRMWLNDPDRLGELELPAVYEVNDAFNDKGLIFIRQGEPDDTQFYVGNEMNFATQKLEADAYWAPGEHSFAAGWMPNESWRYYGSPRMDFFFVLPDGGGTNNWRLTPELTNVGILESLEHWGPPYSEMIAAARRMQSMQAQKEAKPLTDLTQSAAEEAARGGALAREDSLGEASDPISNIMTAQYGRAQRDFESMRRRMVGESRKAVLKALTTDRHTWAEEQEELKLPYVVAAFRGEDGNTDMEIHFALPIGRMAQVVGADAGMINVEMGYAVHDTTWHPVERKAWTQRLPTSPDAAAAAIDFMRLTLPPDTYNVAIHSRPLRTTQIGAQQWNYRAPNYTQPELRMSDLLMANYVGPAVEPSRFNRHGLHVSPNPFLRFSTQQSVYVYFEVYNLTLNADDQTDFLIEYELRPPEPRRKRFGLFGGGDQPALSLRVERSGTDTAPVEYAEIDVAKVDPGQYTLTVRITDRVTGATYERARPIELYYYER